MDASNARPRLLRFGAFEADLRTGELRRQGLKIKLSGQPFQILAMLLEQRGELVTREEIRERLWDGDTFLDFEHSVNNSINRLREALGDDPAAPRFVETLPRHGYRFVAPIEVVPPSPAGDAGAPRGVARGEVPRRPYRAVALAAASVLAIVGWWLLSTRARDVPTTPVEITPFTTEGGLKRLPQLSPDGEKVAYMWAGPADDNWDIYVKALGPRAKPIRLTEHPADDQVPVWSPDGHLIAFRRVTDQGWAIYTVPSLGGQERKLTDVGPSPVWGQGQLGPLPGLAWSPDGKWLALAEQSSKDEPVRIVRLDLATLHRQPLTSPPPGTLGDAQLALSPDGRHLAFVRRRHVVDPGELWVQPTDGGEARRLVSADFCSVSPGYFGLTWTPDGSEVIFTAITTDRPRMLRVPRAGGVPQPVAGIGREARYPSIRGRRMVYEEWAAPPHEIWRVPGRNAIPGQAPEALIFSSQSSNCPAFSPDDRRIAFSSIRSGATNIFVCDSDGSHPTQLTDLARETGMPRWSPDGHWITFDSMAAGDSDVYVIGAEEGSRVG